MYKRQSMTRLIDNMERQHLVVRISDKKDRRTNLIHLTKDGKELEAVSYTHLDVYKRQA